ncbi:hypothetical protein DMC30DRAFT_414738 [Rhodotorula diobovata]|uniref:F-box domain-containing protein n=1 Tax=Rhodotorula diobovata TaxID=5288 RepID=A0A5C5G1A0_9BASI|nr:hypothetical protein DMC30DRAFT_414738 [Rhodotorula diobovata]
MSARSHPARKSAASRLSYAEQPTSSSSEDEEALSDSGREGGAGATKGKRKALRKPAEGKAQAVEEGDVSEGDEEARPPNKARRGPARRIQPKNKRKGKLEALKRLPVEMLTEIFWHLNPCDLLALSMVSKQYRALLTAKSLGRLWKAARDRLDLPAATAGGFTEWQYTQLVFDKHCQGCGVNNVRRADFGIRKRLCKTCRNSKILRLKWKRHHLPNIHPLAKNCVLRPLHSPGDLRWLSNAEYALAEDLQAWSDQLWELEAESDDSSDDIGADEEDGAATQTPVSGGRPARPRRSAAAPSYKEDTSDDDDNRGRREPSRRVKAFVAARQPFLKQIKEEGEAMFYGAAGLREKLHSAHQANPVSFETRMRQMDRADEIAEKVIELDPAYGDCVYTSSFTSHKLVMSDEALTDEEWDRIKPAILKLLARIKKKQDRDALNTRLQNRQRNLRPRYDKLKRALPASARPFVPLFINFLLLPSIKELWSELTVELNDGTWYNQLDAVKEELDQFRLDLALHARELIIAARRDPDDPDEHPTQSGPENEDEAGTPDVSHDFFARATSFVCCTFTSCHKHSTAGDDRISGVVGPLPLVLAHQHARHNQADCLSTTRLCADGPQFRIELPLEVVRAVDALIDLAKLDPATATRDDLVRFDRLVTMYEWTNTLSWKRHAAHWPWTDQAWEDLLYTVKTEADRARKARPPYSLDPPVIECHLRDPSDWARLPLPTVSPSPVQPSKKKQARAPFRFRHSDGGEDSDDDDSDSDEVGPGSRVKVEGSDGASEQESEDDDGVVFRRRVVPDSQEDA